MGNRTNGRGGFAAISAGSPTAVPDPPDWDDGGAYKLDDLVKITTAVDTSYARCVLSHNAQAGGLTAAADGAIEGTQASNWRSIQQGALAALRNWSFSTTETTEQETYVVEEQDRIVGTLKTTSGQLVVADDDADGADVAQRALEVGNEFTLKLYPKGLGSGKPMWSGTARITREDGGFATSVLERTFAFGIQGAWTRTRQA